MGARAAPADRARPRAQRERRRDALHGRERQAATSRAGWPSTAACPTTCARCSTARATRRTSPTASAARRACVLAGKHCESGDVIVRDALLDDPRPGDVIVTPATGAYGYAMANNYNGVPRPPVIFCRDGDARVVVRRESFDDLTARDVRAMSSRAMPAEARLAPASTSACSGTARSARRSPRCSSERAGEIARFNGRAPVISGVLTRSRGDFEEILAERRPDRRADRRDRAGARVPAARRCAPARTSSAPTSSCSPSTARSCSRRAREHGVRLRFEAAVAGRGAGRARARGVAVGHADRAHPRDRQRHHQLHPHRDGRAARATPQALAEAQRCGYAEADPSDDVSGRDAAAKMAILARLAFGTPVHLDDVRYEGIEHLHGDDLRVRARARPRA